MLKILITNQFFQFIVAGGFAAFVNFFSCIFYNKWMTFSESIVLAYLTGMVAAFIIMRNMIFSNTQNSFYKSIFFFALVNLFAVIQTWVVSMAMFIFILPYLLVSTNAKEISHAFGVIVPVFTSYFGHRYLSFK